MAVNPGISNSVLEKYKSNFESDPKNRLAQNVVTKQDLLDACYTHKEERLGHCFTHKVAKEGKPVSNQKSSGRCWIFALVNCLRQPFMEKLDIEEFEFSQVYLFFWDKIERCNYQLDAFTEVIKKGEPIEGRLVQHLLNDPSCDGGQWDMLVNLVEKHGIIPKRCWPEPHSAENSMRMNRIINEKIERCNYQLDVFTEVIKKGEPVEGRLVQHLLRNPSCDGGQWDMLVNLVEKHGIIPKRCWPEPHSAESSMRMNRIINEKMREYCQQLYKYIQNGDDDKTLKERKEKMMEEIYRIVSICLGTPPDTVTWEYYDSKKAYHCVGPVTPQEFYQQLVKPVFNMEDKICLVNDPRPQNPYHEMYTVEYLGNMIGGRRTLYLNQPVEILKKYAAEALKIGEAVWFGCDVGKFFRGKSGINDIHSFEFELVFGTKLGNQSKADRLIFGQSLMTHAMVFTGVSLEEDDTSKPRRWRVENSWGDENGDKGYLAMSDAWFSEFVYEVVVDRKHIPEEILSILKKEPHTLPAWDPMGALA